MAAEPQNRVQIAASHWKPRSSPTHRHERLRAGPLLHDRVEGLGPNWLRTGDVHRGAGRRGLRARGGWSARQAWQRAAWSTTWGSPLVRGSRHARPAARLPSPRTRKRCRPRSARRAASKCRSRGGHSGILGVRARLRGHRRAHGARLDSSKEELYAMENDFLRRGMATLTIDGPGQSETRRRFPIRRIGLGGSPLLDGCGAQDRRSRPRRADGISMGGITDRAPPGGEAAPCRHRARRPYDLSECWEALNPLTRAGTSSTRSRATRTRPSRRQRTLTAARRARQGDLPAAHHPRSARSAVPPAQAERIAREAPKATAAHVSGRKTTSATTSPTSTACHDRLDAATSSVRSAVQPRATPLRDEKITGARSFGAREESRSCARPRRILPRSPILPRSCKVLGLDLG